ncbi:MAG: hypothetical protein B7X39_11735 [Lysobacterales bacterium 14-68-21]|nr:MAG: hypothetical protein B7X45_11770 [Xanthomonadales bacterium 15-68-25]OZB66193.1 MAG: hypothetical protein B7X39_11735 [Xanthomonadales bacterium 14-68-21]
MRRPLALAVLLLLPLSAAAQALPGNDQFAGQLLSGQDGQVAEVSPGVAVPLWRGADGRVLMLGSDQQPAGLAKVDAPLAFSVVGAGAVTSGGVSYRLGPSLQAHAGVTEHSWINASYRVLGSEVGATYNAGRYSLGLSMGADTVNNAARLPRVLPGALPGVNGLSSFGSSTQLNARGRVALDASSGIDLGASVGRIHLLPGNLMGIDTLDQKALSFGVDRGPLSGSLVGRVMQPAAGIPGAYSPDRRWSSIDFGVTWKLPWQGQLSVGAQNLWSSGSSTNTPVGPEPDQSRTPYVQYHQDL